MPLLPDLSPLRDNPAYRRLWVGSTCAGIGSQMAVVAIGLQVYALTSSTAAVGAVAAVAFVPLVVMGLYGGALSDRYDRRRVALVAQLMSWLTSIGCAGLALAGNQRVWPLFVIEALWTGSFAVTSPARSAIYPRILRMDQLPAANALSVFSMNGSMLIGPVLAGLLIDAAGYRGAYVADALITTAALWGFGRLPPVPPQGERRSGSGLRSVVDGLAYLRTTRNVRMTFVADIAAMVLAQPTVLLPAAGTVILGGGARTVGWLYAAVACGGVAAMALSGPLGQLRRQGVAVMLSIVAWGVGVCGLGAALLAVRQGVASPSQGIVIACAAMAVAGAGDAVSAVFRTTILQSAAPDDMRGRLQGVFIAVVAGGPRLGALAGGAVADRIGEPWTGVGGGLACVVAVGVLGVLQPGFLRYDARHPVP